MRSLSDPGGMVKKSWVEPATPLWRLLVSKGFASGSDSSTSFCTFLVMVAETSTTLVYRVRVRVRVKARVHVMSGQMM